MNPRLIITLSLILLTMIACDRAAAPTPTAQPADPSPDSSASESPLSPPPTPTASEPEHTSPLPDPASSPIQPPSESPDQVVVAAKQYLADELGVASDEIAAIAIEPAQWPDASLGCPEPGKAYAQVITLGYRIVLEAEQKEYELHTDQSGQAIVICQRELQRGPAAGVAYLSDELGIPTQDIEVLSVEMYEWPDTSLGCPESGKAYAQVVTTGYRLVLRAQDKKHEVHVDEDGEIVVLCGAKR